MTQPWHTKNINGGIIKWLNFPFKAIGNPMLKYIYIVLTINMTLMKPTPHCAKTLGANSSSTAKIILNLWVLSLKKQTYKDKNKQSHLAQTVADNVSILVLNDWEKWMCKSWLSRFKLLYIEEKLMHIKSWSIKFPYLEAMNSLERHSTNTRLLYINTSYVGRPHRPCLSMSKKSNITNFVIGNFLNIFSLD